LHRIRIKTPEEIRFSVSGNLNVKITPALFVPLIENGFKFASFRDKKPYVDIQLSSESGVVVFEISNQFENNSKNLKSANSGYGIINLKKRLELTYPGKHQLEIGHLEHTFHVKLLIDTNADQLYSN
jgi:LytS/YehU family sensor histidine kinase